MTTEELAMLAIGQIVAAGMFSLGVLVGVSLHRKESKDDNSNSNKAQEGRKDGGIWHRVERR